MNLIRSILIVWLLTRVYSHCNDPVLYYKRILTETRPIKEVLASVSTDGKTHIVIKASIQTNTFYFLKVSTSDPALSIDTLKWDSPTSVMCGSSYSHIWSIGASAVFLAEKSARWDLIPQLPNITNNAIASANAGLELLNNYLLYGMGLVNRGTLKFTGNQSFTAVSKGDQGAPPGEVSGRILKVGANGVSLVSYALSSLPNREFQVHYTYTQDDCCYPPAVVTRSIEVSNVTHVLSKTHYHRMEFGKNDFEMGSSGYTPSMFLSNRVVSALFVFTNDVAYRMTQSGLEKVDERTIPKRRTWTVTIVITIALVIPATLMLKRWHQN